MAIDSPVINVAVLNCGYTSPVIEKERGQYHDIFRVLLRDAVHRSSSLTNKPNLHLEGWDVVNQKYPLCLDRVDAIIVTGSPNSAYQPLEWIYVLQHYVSRVYIERPHIKLYGSCFGHQIICKALFEDHGAIIQKDPAGYELGVHAIDVSEEFASRFATLLPTKSLRLQFLHGDHVILPPSVLPEDACVIGSTPHCANQGIYQPGRLLTYQGHPEFDQFIEMECLKLVSARVGWPAKFTEEAITSAATMDDAAIAAEIIVSFLLEPTVAEQ
ncbi:hypothetical protein CDV36_007214 [Fusarium kuroshium]|uniref:Glutamine amidotransferase domain-containing protein n=1 Tax=Fusarium kuroshium TaxID=2010991 RepID=A0A3M2S6C6_9HYPO|nr:hypothetical protein CDV36_007214 [Fusarium kuroshium]